MALGTHDLELFVRDALARGASRAEVERVMREAGWTVEQAASALKVYADIPFVVPVPRPRPYLSAREAFTYLVLFSTLYASAIHFGSLLFDFINLAFPDPSEQPSAAYWANSVRWAVSWLVIAFPVFLFMSRSVARSLARDPVKRLSPIRRWLTYATLFFAASFLIGDMTTLVYRLLGGDLTIRFILKVLVVAGIAGMIFGYYLSDLKQEETE